MRNSRAKARGQRGFALLMVVMIVAVVGLIGVTMLNLIQIDMSIVGQTRSNWEANAAALVANFELATDQGTVTQLPPLSAPIRTGVTPPVGSVMSGQALEKSAKNYSADIYYLNWTPIADSTLTVTRGLVYELRTTSTIKTNPSDILNLSQAESRSEVTFVTTFPAGSLLPRVHAR